MKLIKLNESQYKRLFESSVDFYTEDNPSSVSDFKDQSQVGLDAKMTGKDGDPVNQKPLGGIQQGPDGEFGRTGLDKNMSRNGAFNSGGLRGGTGGF